MKSGIFDRIVVKMRYFPYHNVDRKNGGWYAEDEMGFIANLVSKAPMTALRYCDFILDYGRRWDETVDVGAVLGFAEKTRMRIRQHAA